MYGEVGFFRRLVRIPALRLGDVDIQYLHRILLYKTTSVYCWENTTASEYCVGVPREAGTLADDPNVDSSVPDHLPFRYDAS